MQNLPVHRARRGWFIYGRLVAISFGVEAIASFVFLVWGIRLLLPIAPAPTPVFVLQWMYEHALLFGMLLAGIGGAHFVALFQRRTTNAVILVRKLGAAAELAFWSMLMVIHLYLALRDGSRLLTALIHAFLVVNLVLSLMRYAYVPEPVE